MSNLSVANDKAASLAASALTKLSQALAQGDSDSLKAYLAFAARFHNYSFRNQTLILFQKPEATQVAGFKKWQELGRYVRKGEKGIAILVPIKYKPKDQTGLDLDNKSDQVESEMTVVGFTTGYVFDVSQTDGQPLPELQGASGDPQCFKERLFDLIYQRGIKFSYANSLGGAKGVSSGGAICIVHSMSPAEEFLVLTHELAHELLHKGERRCQTTKQIRELEAEAVAFTVATAIGLDCPCSFDYIRLYKGDKKMLAESLGFVQQTSATILEAIL